MKEIVTNSSEQTQALAKSFAQTLQGGDIILLRGGLGSGKTTFTKGLAVGLGIQARIISPTFVIIRMHTLEENPGEKKKIKNMYHLDLYRVDSEEAVLNLGLRDLTQDKESVTIIEWPEKAESLLPKKRYDIQFEYIEENRRRITIDQKV